MSQRMAVGVENVVFETRRNPNLPPDSLREIPNAIESLKQLNSDSCYAGNVWLIAQGEPQLRYRTNKWLEHHDFYDRTGIPKEHILFSRKSIGKLLIARELGVKTFVDGSLESLAPMAGTVPQLSLLNPSHKDLDRHSESIPDVDISDCWHKLFKYLTGHKKQTAKPDITLKGGCVLADDRDNVLLVTRADYKGWGLPKGHQELGEKLEETAKRETLEETGYKVGLAGLIDAVRYRTTKGKDVVAWYFRADHLRYGGDPEEICKWIDVETAAELVHPQIRDIIQRREEFVRLSELQKASQASL